MRMLWNYWGRVVCFLIRMTMVVEPVIFIQMKMAIGDNTIVNEYYRKQTKKDDIFSKAIHSQRSLYQQIKSDG
jgi:hypothetical protein